MTGHRASYRKTVAAVSLAAALGLVAVSWTLVGALRAVSWTGRVAWSAAALGLAGGVAAAGLVVIGGVIALRRDALEALGRPYPPRRRREWLPGAATQAVRRAARRLVPPDRRRPGRLALRPGEMVEVRPLEQILATLDGTAALDGLPFMPEMASLCGRRFRVHRRVDKLNDWVGHTGLRRLHETVLLEQARCDGSGHDGCQASCHLRWKEAWLRRVPPDRPDPAAPAAAMPGQPDLARLAQRAEGGEVRHVCQATALASGTTPLRRGDPRHYLRDLWRGNIRMGPLAAGVSIALFNWVQRARRGVTYPLRVTSGATTSPTLVLGLQPGERVRVRSKAEIAGTLNIKNRNRGLWFDGEMLRFCGGSYRVQARAERLIEESTGRMLQVENPCILLDGVTASGEYLGFCAQNEAILWREIWLEREVATSGARPGSADPSHVATT